MVMGACGLANVVLARARAVLRDDRGAHGVLHDMGDGYVGEYDEVDGNEENGYMQNQMEEEDTEGESDADDSNESDDEAEVPIRGRWNHNFSSAMTISDGLDSNWEYHQNNVVVGAMFPSKRHMQDAIIKWAMASQRQLRTTVSSGKYLTMECVDINCPERVHGYVPKYDTTWRVSDFVAHTCELASIRNDHSNLTSNLIARLLYTEIVEGQAMGVKSIQKNVKKHHLYTISYGKAWRAKQRAMEMRFGSFRDAYDAVVRLLQTLQARNPDTYVNIQDLFLPEFPTGFCIESISRSVRANETMLPMKSIGSYVAEWDGATTHVWRHDEQFDPQEFDAYLQRYTAANRVPHIPPTDPAEAPPMSMHDMYPTQSTVGRQHADTRSTYYNTQQNYVGMQTPPPEPTQETRYDPESGSWIPARNTGKVRLVTPCYATPTTAQTQPIVSDIYFLLLRLRRSPAGILLHHHHHAVVLLGFRGDIPHLRCPLERERKELHRHRTRDRVRKCCRIAASGTIVYTNNEINLVGFGIFEDHGAPSINFNQFLEKEKLKGNGSNFTDWFRHVRIFLAGVSLQYVLEAPLGSPPPPAVSEDIKNVYETRVTRYSEVQCAILCSLEAELQKRFEHHDPCDMMCELKLIFETHAAVESYEASKQFFNCMMEEGSSVSEHMFAMSGHAKKLSDLGIVIPNKLGIHRVLQSLPPSYKNFVMNYNMQNMNKELPELFSMLKSAEVEIKKENQVLMVNKTTSFKKQGKPNKGNFKKGGKKVAAPPEKPKAGPKPETVCYYCQGKGHWKRNCTKYLADLKSGHAKKKVKRMKKLHSDGLLESLDFESLDRCEACLMGKMTKTPFSGTMERATDLLEIIHTDVCGPMSVASRGGYRYVLTFTDDLSRYGYIYFMKHKSETFEKFKEFQSEVENQRNKKIKFLRSDRGGEYLSYEFGMHLKKCGILSQLTPPGTPQRNGVSERRNRTLLDMVRSMMSLTDLPLSFWGYALETAAFTLNRAPSKSVETTPYELWFGKKPKLSFLKVWGCDAYVKKLQPDKLEPKAEKCVFIGYPKETIGVAQCRKKFLQPAPIGEEANDEDHETSNEEATEPRRSTRERTTPDWYDPCLNVMIVDDNDEDPATYEEVMMSPDSNKWQEAMKSEMGSMYDNKVWTLVDLPDSRKAVENKWIFKRKTDADGNITVYKARLVAKGFRQIQGVDYDETFSPVAKLKSVRILLAIAAFFDYEIWQMDVKTAFLNGDIEEELYMSGYVFVLNGAAVSWSSSKKCTVAKSSTESEYIAASEASSEAVWMKRFIVELGVVPSALDPLVIYCDNTGAIANAKEPRKIFVFYATNLINDPGDDVEGEKPRKRVPAKVMWYAPIIPRLKRLFRNKEHAKLLRWHKEDRKSDGELRHPADGTQWRKIDREFKDFAADARNIRFGLSTDGMNPFGEQSSSHSTWPVTLCIYNLPPWLCMKRKFIMMSVLIQGPKQPGNDIDVYLRPLVDELLQLWGRPGVRVWDEHKEEEFDLRALLFVFGRPKGLGHLFKEAKGHPKGTTSRSPSSPSRSTTLRPNPSYSLLLLLPQRLRRSPAGDLHHHRHHAVVLAGFRGGSTTSAARWNGEEDVVFINTVRVTEYGGAARLCTVKFFYALLQAASDRLHPPRDLISLGFGNLRGLVS
ncbi:hypothetical protein QYE76_063802 [Lolium multiflorum]|uniref:Retrotransposon protein, putative, Ty1-copia subclass n=1 Tax=Lolium multiflorum TaxID=4521 RepID=A0AAD8S5Q8_LOLMU|nr:hypothetical protein QYE76_063802 [Lolium multiflorum]